MAGSRPGRPPAHSPPLPRPLLPPQETLAWLANPANLNSEVLPPGLEAYDPTAFLTSAVNVFLVTLLPQLAHETAHGVAAQLKGIKIGPS